MIVLWGLPNEAPLASVWHALERKHADVAVLDQRDVLRTHVRLHIGGPAPGRVRGCLEAPSLQLDLAGVRAAYIRPFEPQSLSAVKAAASQAFALEHAASVHSSLWSWVQ